MVTGMEDGSEHVDVVVVGARCAGSATAISLARRGRRVLVLDGSSFPSDTLSTHLLFPSHIAELERLGVREEVEALGAPQHDRASLWGEGHLVAGPYSGTEGFAYGSCVRRTGLDATLVDGAREAGAEVREKTKVTDLVRGPSGRVGGVRWRDRDGATGTVTAPLVVGADGRRSFVAEQVGARKHHERDNERLMAFAYYDDPHHDQRGTAQQWRAGRELGTVFPCDGGLSLVLLMSPRERAGEFREDKAGAFERTVAAIPPMAERLRGCEPQTKIRMSVEHPSYFRHSAGPGWALVGDAGHFKDPVTAQGIRDALRFGRLLGEAVAPVLDDPAALDRATLGWEDDRDRQCLDMYQWANGLGIAEEVSPLEAASYRWFAERPGGATEVFDVFSRKRSPQDVFSAPRALTWAGRAARDPEVDLPGLARTLRRDVARELSRRAERRRFRGHRETARVSTAPGEG